MSIVNAPSISRQSWRPGSWLGIDYGEAADAQARALQSRVSVVSPHPCMGSELSREGRLLGAIFCAEARRDQGWPEAIAGGGASAALRRRARSDNDGPAMRASVAAGWR